MGIAYRGAAVWTQLYGKVRTEKPGVASDAAPTSASGRGFFGPAIVIRSPVRVETMVAVQALSGGAGSSVFLFAAAAESLEEQSPLDLEWVSGKGERVCVNTAEMAFTLCRPIRKLFSVSAKRFTTFVF